MKIVVPKDNMIFLPWKFRRIHGQIFRINKWLLQGDCVQRQTQIVFLCINNEGKVFKC